MSRGRCRSPVQTTLSAVMAAAVCLTVACTAGGPAGTGTAGPSMPATGGSSPSSAVPERTVDFVAMKGELTSRLREGDPALRAVRSVLVSVHGETVVSHYQARKPTERAHVWSVTKSVMSILLGIAIDEGRLRLDQTLSELLTMHQARMSPDVASITLRQLLTMTAGIADSGMGVESADPVGDILSYGLVSEPGAQFVYSDTGAHLVAAVLAEAIDRPMLDYAREKLFDPLEIRTRPAWQGWDTGSAGNGFDKPGFAWATNRSGINLGGFGLKLTAPDMIKLGELYVNGGNWNGRQIVSQDWVRESTAPQVTKEQQPEAPYGFFWWLGETNQHPLFEAAGAFGQTILCVPDLHLVVVVTSAVDGAGSRDLRETYVPVIEQVIVNPLAS